MDIVQISRIVGFVIFTFFLCLKSWIWFDDDRFARSGRIAGLWMLLYFYFLLLLRGLSLLGIGSQNELTILASWAIIIPLIAVIVHLFLYKKAEDVK